MNFIMARNKRIDSIVEALKGYHTALDIGTDHGYVLKHALDHHYIKKGIASDLRKQPLGKAKNLLKNYPVDFFLSDGFLSIDQPFDVVVIAGMGSHTTIEIMKQRLDTQADFILMPHDHLYEIRTFLCEHGFVIDYEKIIEDRHFYTLFKVFRGTMTLSEKEIYTGYHVIINDTYKKYIKKMMAHYQALVSKTHSEKQAYFKKIESYFMKVLNDIHD